MTRWTPIPLGIALVAAMLGLSACAGGAGTAEPTATSPQVLLDAAQVPGGSWTAARTGTARWADLEESMVPCGQRVIAPEDAQVRFRVFESADGASVSVVVVSGVDAMQAFKRFYAECGAVGEVGSEPGPHHVARHAGEVEVAGFTGDHLIVVSGPAAREDLGRITDAATAQAARAG